VNESNGIVSSEFDDEVTFPPERFARATSRRTFIRRVAETTFLTIAYFALDGIHAPKLARGAVCDSGGFLPGALACTPPDHTYCTQLSSSYCSDSVCAGGCTKSGCGGWNPQNCWCTELVCSGSNTGYWICCDCDCFGTCCGCRQWVSTGGCAPVKPTPTPKPTHHK
jgi:hypothetical protein